jgi:ABC-2 type transport system permease protein
MTTIATKTSTITTTPADSMERMPFISQVIMLTRRSLTTNLRVPAAIIPGMIISLFFLVIYESTLGGASNFLPGLSGKSYLGFILPLSVVSAALSASGIAGQSIVRDIERGYFDKLMLTPVSRVALVLGPMLAGAVLLAFQTTLVVGVAVLMGLRPETGVLGLAAVIGFALLLGVGFGGFTVGVALLTGSSAATQGAGFLFFPLSFLTASFVPLALLEGWIKVAATVNPITYILDAQREILLNGWSVQPIVGGLVAILLLSAVMLGFAVWALRTRTRRK